MSPYYSNPYLDFFQNLEVSLSEEYIQSSGRFALIMGLCGAVCILVAAFLLKRARGLAVFAALCQAVGGYATQKMVHSFLQMDLVAMEVFTGSSQAEVDAQIDAFYANYFTNMFRELLPLMVCSVLSVLSFAMTLVFLIRTLKIRPRGLAVTALVLHVVRYVFISPINFFGAITGPLTEAAQQSTDKLYCIATLLPTVLILLAAILSAARRGADGK